MASRRLEFRILGPLDVRVDGVAVSVGGPKQRALLALLLLHANEVVSRDRLIDELVPDRAGKAAADVLNVQVSRLRKSLEAADAAGSRLVARSPGYLLRVEPGELDVDRFEQLLGESRAAREQNDPASAAELLRKALSLWRGRPLADLEYEPFALSEVERLEELRLVAVEDRFDAELALGRHAELVPELELLVHEHPSRERLLGQLMVSLYRSGRQSEALAAYAVARGRLAEELGLEPSRSLRDLEQSILRQDPALDRPSPPAHPSQTPAQAGARSRRLTLGVAATLLGIAAIAGLLIAATVGRNQKRPSAASLRVALVEARQRNLTPSNPLYVDPIGGLRTAAQQLGVQTKVFYGGSQPRGFLRTIAAAARKYNLVIIGPWPTYGAVSKLTRRFPNTRFLVFDSVHDPLASFAGQRNVTGVNFDDRQNGYLGGYLAGLMTHGNQAVSAVGGAPTRAVQNLIAGFGAGARHARPGIRVLVKYTGTFRNQSACAAAATKQIDQGSAVVFDAAGQCGVGALSTALFRGAWGLGVDDNLSPLGPRNLASVAKRFNIATEIAVMDFVSGQLPGGLDLPFDFANNGIGLVGINNAVPPGVRAKVNQVRAKLTAASPPAAGSVASSLSGHRRLGHRIQWVATPNIASYNVVEVVFRIDGRKMWDSLTDNYPGSTATENNPPYDYGGSRGSYLVTSFLSPGVHTFTVQVQTVNGRTAHTSTRAVVPKAPKPPARLAGPWHHYFKGAGQGSPPSGIWKLDINSVGWQIHDTQGTGDLLDVVYPKPGELQIQTGMVTGHPNFDQNGWCNNDPGPTLLYSWRVTNSGLRLHLLHGHPCQGFNQFATSGHWTRSS